MVFDRRLLLQTAYASGVSKTVISGLISRSEERSCIMELANRYFYEHLEWDHEKSCFKRLSLERCLEIAGIDREGTAHRALSDAPSRYRLTAFYSRKKTNAAPQPTLSNRQKLPRMSLSF